MTLSNNFNVADERGYKSLVLKLIRSRKLDLVRYKNYAESCLTCISDYRIFIT